MSAENRKILMVLADPLSSRIFFDSHIIRKLHEQLGDRLQVITPLPASEFEHWIAKLPGLHFLSDQSMVYQVSFNFLDRARSIVDRFLDARIGYFPLALRFNLHNSFHMERMTPGHKNAFLDLSRMGTLPDWKVIYRLMFRWLYNRSRFVPPKLFHYLKENSDLMVVSNLQVVTMLPYLVTARRLGLPVAGYIASWDHPFGKGVTFPWADRYIVQNESMKTALAQLHNIPAGRIDITGWPQTDVFSVPRPRAAYETLLKSYGLDPSRRCVLIAGNTEVNAPYESFFLERFLQWWRTNRQNDWSLIFRPHPKNTSWKTRYQNIQPQSGFFFQPPSYTDIETLGLLLRHVDGVVTNAGTILLDSLINDRPVVCTLYDENAPPGVIFAALNVLGEHYKELVASDSFYSAKTFDETTSAIDRCLAAPAEKRDARRIACAAIVGNVDGHAAERVAASILSCIPS